MPHPDGSGWLLTYANPRNDTRMLVSLPSAMLRDLRLLAKAKDISAAELVRRAVTREIAAEIKSRPEIAASFKGTLPT
ncbi:MAG: hypothetical protein KatS3mg015_2642 [Fimbriimonadales bacterium]|nr:MAG: hypothetical protein KatS3mg015_2642 [Fimbriimonadales bacterium]